MSLYKLRDKNTIVELLTIMEMYREFHHKNGLVSIFDVICMQTVFHIERIERT